ncbi:MAG TPA: GAF domain-containing protein, partial [Anaerolineales bacterium]|nr:GAF domain-containing protein [Anaerolineales bacterium]
MKRLAYPQNKSSQYLIIITTYIFYVIMFAMSFEHIGLGIAPLAIIPVIAGSWYFGIQGGILVGILCIITNILVPTTFEHPLIQFIDTPGSLEGSLALIILAIIVGRLSTVTRERKEAISRLEKYERDRRSYTDFLEVLNGITGMAFEANRLEITLKILVEKIGKLFKADDCFFTLWDEVKGVPIPTAAYGSISDIYPYIQFEPGDRTPTVSVIEAGHPIAIEDFENSAYVSPKVAAIFPSRSMLALPLIAQRRNLGALLLGYNRRRSFDKNDLIHAELTAEQVALVLSKSLLLEEERKRVKQLTGLHDISLISIEVDN